MRTLFLSLFLLSACRDGPPGFDAPLPPPGPITVEREKVQLDLALLRKSIQVYKAEHEGASPPDLKALGVEEQLTYKLDLSYQGRPLYEYDPAEGKVRAPDYPGL